MDWSNWVSLMMFVWIALAIYIGIGSILKHVEKEMHDDPIVLNDTILDDALIGSYMDMTE